MAAGEYLPPLVTELKADIAGLKKGFDEAKAEARRYKKDIDGLSGNFQQVKKDATEAGRSVTDFDRLVGSKMKSSASAVKTLRKEYEQLQDKIKELRKDVRSGKGDGNAANELKGAIADAAKMSSIASDFGIKLGDAAGKGLGNAMTAAGPVIQTALVAVLIAAAVLAAPAVGAAIAAAATIGLGAGVIGLAAYILKDDKQIKKAWEKLTETTSGVFQRAVQPMKAPFVKLLGWLNTEFKKLEPELKNLFAAAAPLVKPLGEGIFGIIKNALPGITQALKNAEPVFKVLGEKLPLIGTAIGDFFAALSSDPEALSIFTSDLITWVAAWIVAIGKFLGWLTTMYKEVRDKIAAVIKWFSELRAKIIKAFVNPTGILGGVGAAIMDGLIGGINSRIPALTGALRTAMAAGVAASKKQLKSKSPSLVYFQMGEDSAKGYELGATSRMDRVRASMAAMVAPRTTAALSAVPTQRGSASHAEVTGVAHIYLDSRHIQQAGIKYAQRDAARNGGSTGWS